LKFVNLKYTTLVEPNQRSLCFVCMEITPMLKILKKCIYTICLILLILLGSLGVNAQENAEIRKIKIKGNHEFKDGELLDKITFSKSSWIKRNVFKKEPSIYSSNAWEMNKAQLRVFYQSEGFLHVEIKEPVVEVRPRKYRVDLAIKIEEGDPVTVNSLDFRTKAVGEEDSILSSDEWAHFKKSLLVDVGQCFKDDEVNRDKEAIAFWFSSRGYAYVNVKPRISLTPDTLGAGIIWQIEKGPFSRFGDITVEGAKRTPEEAIRNQFAIEKGDPYSSGKLALSQKQVYELGLFRIASMQARRSTNQTDSIPVKLTIEEAPRLVTRYGAGYGREDHFRTFVDVRYLNFPGKTQRTNFFAKHSGLEPYRFEAAVTQPAVFGPNSSMALNPYVRKRDEPGFDSFVWGENLSFQQNMGKYLTASVSLYFERVDIDIASDFEQSINDFYRSSYSKNGISPGILYYTARPRFDPVDGWSLALNTRGSTALFDSPYPFWKYIFEIKRYQPLMNGLVLAARLKAGSIFPTGSASSTPVEERFFAGGSQSVRGWARQMLGPLDDDDIPRGGNSILEGSFEPRIKIVDPVSMVFFLDYGNVWSNENAFDLGDVRFAAGSGVRVSTPIGPVGIDFARPVFDKGSNWQFHLNIGHAF
jgi:outer membrane protein insertion porin family